jgi:alkaline phosphatase
MRMTLIFLVFALHFAVPLAADENDTVPIRRFAEVSDATAINDVEKVKNIIIMIGDGMGHEAVTAARMAAFGRGIGLAMDRMPVMGHAVTYSLSDDLITDSAAGATALATGVKTTNSRIGEDSKAGKLKTILELAHQLGKSTGLVAACDITHATPASFASHVKNRNNYWEIARQLSQAPVDVMLGGGYGYFLPGKHQESLRDDDLDLLERMRKNGRIVLTGQEQFESLDLNNTQSLVGLFSSGHSGKAGVREPGLIELAETALEILSRNPKGFFLMIEGSQIDWAGHDKDFEYSVGETLDFDRAVEAVRRFAERDGNTLLIVTADHETGGLSINKASEKEKTLTAGWTSGSHTANMVPVYAFGPNAEAFYGIHQNHHIPQLAVQGWGVKNFTRFAYDN